MTGVQSLPRISCLKKSHGPHRHRHTHTRAHYICLHCTFAPLHITDLLSTFESNSGDSSKLTPSKQKKSWRAITDIIGFHFNHVSGKKTCHHPGENGAKIQSLYLLHCIEGVCLCICTDWRLRVHFSVCQCGCVLHISMHKIRIHIHKCQMNPEKKREKWVPLMFFYSDASEEDKLKTVNAGQEGTTASAVPLLFRK